MELPERKKQIPSSACYFSRDFSFSHFYFKTTKFGDFDFSSTARMNVKVNGIQRNYAEATVYEKPKEDG